MSDSIVKKCWCHGCPVDQLLPCVSRSCPSVGAQHRRPSDGTLKSNESFENPDRIDLRVVTNVKSH